MGRHRRTAPDFRDTPVYRAEPAPADGGHRRPRRRKHHPVRTGLLASSAAMAVGAIGVSAGLLPSPDGSGGFSYHDGGQIQAGDVADNGTSTQGATAPITQEHTSAPPANRGQSRSS